MGINITQTMNSFQFESRENLRNTARDILNKQGASQKTVQKILEKTIFDNHNSAQLAIMKASTQIKLNESLKETLKYLNNKATKRTQKTPVFGELWNQVNNDENKIDIIEMEFNFDTENIFAAA